MQGYSHYLADDENIGNDVYLAGSTVNGGGRDYISSKLMPDLAGDMLALTWVYVDFEAVLWPPYGSESLQAQ
jgi:hypothetical protein